MPTQKHGTITAQGFKKLPGWYSSRHETRDAQDEARETYFATHATARARIVRRSTKVA